MNIPEGTQGTQNPRINLVSESTRLEELPGSNPRHAQAPRDQEKIEFLALKDAWESGKIPGYLPREGFRPIRTGPRRLRI